MAVDATGDAYVTGLTTSIDFPVRNGFQTGPAGGGSDMFVTRFSTTRSSVVYSTYVGGSGIDTATGIAVDSEGSAYVTGGTTSAIFPIFNPIQSALRGDREAFLFKLNPTGTSLVYSTYLGGGLKISDIALRSIRSGRRTFSGTQSRPISLCAGLSRQPLADLSMHS